jgi:hypothetical protein
MRLGYYVEYCIDKLKNHDFKEFPPRVFMIPKEREKLS